MAAMLPTRMKCSTVFISNLTYFGLTRLSSRGLRDMQLNTDQTLCRRSRIFPFGCVFEPRMPLTYGHPCLETHP